ncbi:hypothetical protein ACFYKX_14325 [Cytobacillus sp. FJAT-54145]|uniref:Gas vesicle protein n=1 Tax=Cytobacillus spartinae TaxID=3299023 RepID=A0ABW6KC63_9BACI
MGFLSNTFLGDLISKSVDRVDRQVQKGFDHAEKKIDEFDKRGQKVGKAIDNIGHTVKSMVQNGPDRNDFDLIHQEKKTIKENLPKGIPVPDPIKKPLKALDKTVDGIHVVHKAVDKYYESK